MASFNEAMLVLAFLGSHVLIQAGALPQIQPIEGIPKNILLNTDQLDYIKLSAVRLTSFANIKSSLESGHVVNFEADLRQCMPAGIPIESIGGNMDNFRFINTSGSPAYIWTTFQRHTRQAGNIEYRHVQIDVREDDVVEIQLIYWTPQNGLIRDSYNLACRLDNGLNGGDVGFFAIGSSPRDLPDFISVRDALRAGRKVTTVTHYNSCLINGQQDPDLLTIMGSHVLDYDIINENRIDFTTGDARRKSSQPLMGDMIYNVRTHEVYSNGTVLRYVSNNDYKFEQEQMASIFECAIHLQVIGGAVHFLEIY